MFSFGVFLWMFETADRFLKKLPYFLRQQRKEKTPADYLKQMLN